MDAGNLNRRVVIERRAEVPDDTGGQEFVWEEDGGAWVKATPVAGKEALLGGTLAQSQPWRLETRFRTDITARDRLAASWLPAGHRIAIESVADMDGRRESIVIWGTSSLAPDLEPI